MGEITRLEANTQPIYCQFNLYCRGGIAAHFIARSPLRHLWVPLCPQCTAQLLGTVPVEALRTAAAVQGVILTSITDPKPEPGPEPAPDAKPASPGREPRATGGKGDPRK